MPDLGEFILGLWQVIARKIHLEFELGLLLVLFECLDSLLYGLVKRILVLHEFALVSGLRKRHRPAQSQNHDEG